MIPISECRKYLPSTLSDDEVKDFRDEFYTFWENIYTYLENNK